MKKIFQSRLWVACLLCCAMLPVQAQETYGRSDAPLVAEVLDVQIRTSNLDEAAYVIKQVLVKQYIEDNKLPATAAELAEFLQRKQRMMEKNRIKLETRRDQIRQTLTEASLTTQTRAQLEKEQAINTPWWLSLRTNFKDNGQPPAAAAGRAWYAVIC